MSGQTWYHGTDTTETVSTTGLDAALTLGTPGSDDRGFFLTPDESIARLYAIGKTRARIILGEIPSDARPVILAAAERTIGSLLAEPEFPMSGERYIPLDDYPKVPRDAFRRIWTG